MKKRETKILGAKSSCFEINEGTRKNQQTTWKEISNNLGTLPWNIEEMRKLMCSPFPSYCQGECPGCLKFLSMPYTQRHAQPWGIVCICPPCFKTGGAYAPPEI